LNIERENLAWKGFTEKESRIMIIWLVPLCQGENKKARRNYSGFAIDGNKSWIELNSST
jgi:hypothetical protein